MSQKKQKEIVEKFRNEETDILVATSIGEEGLDIPIVDLVIFYEPIPIPPAVHTARRRLRHLPAGVRRGVRRWRDLPAHHASARDRVPVAHLDPRGDHSTRAFSI